MDQEEEKPNVELPDEEDETQDGEVDSEEEGTTTEGEGSEEEESTEKAAKKETESATGEEEDEQTNVQKRIDRLVWEREELKRRNSLLKTNPEEYYRQFPEERPATALDKKTEPEADEYESMIIRGGQYDGWTLGDLAREKPLTAQKILNDYLDSQRRSAQELEEKKSLAKQAWENDVNTFGAYLCGELFEKKPDELSREERAKVDEAIYTVAQWKEANRKNHYSFQDAYLLMNKDHLLKSAREKAANKIVGDLKKNPVGSISGKADRSSQSIDLSTMSEDQLGAHVSRMSDKEAAKFYREAPQALRDKYPSWPWD